LIKNTYNLTKVVNFLREYSKIEALLDNAKLNSISVSALDRRLSDHDAQIPVLQNTQIPFQKMSHKNITD